jgi:hypothetical protein
MLALGSFTSAFFDANSLTTLKLAFNEYSVFHERPTVSLADLLPLKKPWPHLRRLSLHFMPLRLAEFQILVGAQRNTLTKFKGSSLYLLDGSWPEALDALRGFDNLQQFKLRVPRGGMFGDGEYSNTLEEEMCRYVMKLVDRNPLQALIPNI